MKMRTRTSRTRHNRRMPTTKTTTIATFCAKTSSSLLRCTPAPSAEVLRDRRHDFRFRHGAEDASLLHAVLEKDEQRNSVNAETYGALRILVDIQLRHPHVASLRRELFQHRRDHATRSAPRRPEVDDRRTTVGDHAIEVVVRHFDRHAAQRRLATPANRMLSAAERGDAIRRVTI